jgi:hypothetical protein
MAVPELVELFDRIPPLVRGVLDGLDPDLLSRSPGGTANPIGWLLWHIARVEDHQVSELAGGGQVWVEDGWAERFGLEPDPSNMGFGHSSDDVAAVQPESADAIVEYLDVVAERTRSYLDGLASTEVERVIDDSYDPPVTVLIRLISVAGDALEHAGQAAYARGLLESVG